MNRPLFYFLCLTTLLWLAGFAVFVISLPTTVPSVSQKTDALVVLTGGGDRLEAALALMHQHVAAKMLISGVHPQTTLRDIMALDRQKESPLPASVIFLDHHAHSTLENAQQTVQWVQKHHVKSVRLVTAHYHMRRALLEFHQNLPQVMILSHPIVPRVFQNSHWFYHRDVLWLLWREYHKYLGALMRCGLKSTSFYPKETLS